MWYRYKDKLPEKGRKILLSYKLRHSEGIFFSTAHSEDTECRRKADEKDCVYWWRYATPDDEPPIEIKVGDEYVSKLTASLSMKVIGIHGDMYWCVVMGDFYTWTREDIEKYYKKVN